MVASRVSVRPLSRDSRRRHRPAGRSAATIAARAGEARRRRKAPAARSCLRPGWRGGGGFPRMVGMRHRDPVRVKAPDKKIFRHHAPIPSHQNVSRGIRHSASVSASNTATPETAPRSATARVPAARSRTDIRAWRFCSSVCWPGFGRVQFRRSAMKRAAVRAVWPYRRMAPAPRRLPDPVPSGRAVAPSTPSISTSVLALPAAASLPAFCRSVAASPATSSRSSAI